MKKIIALCLFIFMFTLNPKVVKINNEITELQRKCNHHYVEGQCEFCYHLEGVNE